MRRVIALFLVMVTLSGMMCGFTGCSNESASESAYMTKGEWLLLFTSETNIKAYEYKAETGLIVDNKYYEAVYAVIETDLLSVEEASSDLDKAAEKEIVAKTCVNYLYFRKTYDIKFKDERKIKDPQIAADAVGGGIVKAENDYFKPDAKMTFDDCKAAIIATVNIDANGTFDTEESKIDVVLKDDVIDLGNLPQSDFSLIYPDDIEYAKIANYINENNNKNKTIATASMLNTRPYSTVSTSTLSTDKNKATNADFVVPSLGFCESENTNSSNVVIVKILSEEANKRNLKPGDTIANGFDANTSKEICVPVKIDSTIQMGDSSFKYFKCTILPFAEGADVNKMATTIKFAGSDGITLEKLPSIAGVSIDKCSLTGSGLSLKISYNKSAKENQTNYREPSFGMNISYEVNVSNISLTIGGFEDIVSEKKIKNAMFKLNYDMTNTFKISSSVKVAPDDNRNGHFLSNLKRSRLTGEDSKGAGAIKIARIPWQIGYGFFVELYVTLNIKIDGSLEVTLTSPGGSKGIKILNNHVSPLSEKSPTLKIEVAVNLQAYLEFDLSLQWGIPNVWSENIINAILDIGVEVDAVATLWITEDANKGCVKNTQYFRDAELMEYKKDIRLQFEYCFDLSIKPLVKVKALTGSCLVGQIIRVFDSKANLEWDIIDYLKIEGINVHFEDGHVVSSCTRECAEKAKDEGVDSPKIDQNFSIDLFKISVDMISSQLVKISAIPVGKETLDKNLGGINVYVKDPNIAYVTYLEKDSSFVVCGVSEGVTEIIIESSNKRFIQTCSVDVYKSL